MDIIVYDGTYAGLLTAFFEIYEYKFRMPVIKKENFANRSLFGGIHLVATDRKKAGRVMLKFQSLFTSSALLKLKYAFLSEEENIENNMFQYIQYTITQNRNIARDLSKEFIIAVDKAAHKTGREAHRMTGFVRFQLSGDNLYFATIEPNHDVLPVIIKHFKDRFASQKWLIYDLHRRYGIYYDMENISEVNIDIKNNSASHLPGLAMHEDEVAYQTLWKQYFKSTNIAARKNTKLHIQHLPKRYWKHLTEKIIL